MRALITSLLILVPGIGWAETDDTLPSLEGAAARLQAAVVTVRVSQRGAATGQDPDQKGPRVMVCSGVSLGKGLVVTPIYAGSDAEIRITIPGGDQATGKVRVLDEYSGLALLEIDRTDVPGFKLADDAPKVGSWIMSAAGWGAEKPVVSLGIVAGVDRTLPAANFPPLLQCDLRTAATSSGAAVVNQQGALLGIVVLVENAQQRGWTYAIPVRHVKRLLRTREQNAERDSFVVLKRRRPEVGMHLDGQQDEVHISRVLDDSPAQRAGLKVGDQIVAVDGMQIRSVYQALRPVIVKQPGDTVDFLVKRADSMQTVQVVLSGNLVLPSAPFANLSQYVRPKIDIEGLGAGRYRASDGRGGVREVFAPGEPEAVATATTTDEKIQLLQKALSRYQSVIVYLQDQLRQSEEERAEAERLLKSLKDK